MFKTCIVVGLFNNSLVFITNKLYFYNYCYSKYTFAAVLKNRAEILTTPRSVTVPMKGGPAVVITVLVVTVIGTVMCLVVHFIWPEAVCLRNPWKLLGKVACSVVFKVN